MHVLQLDDERERLLESQADRQARQQRADAERAGQAIELERIRGLKAFAQSCIPRDAPPEVLAAIVRDIERSVIAERYPPQLAREHVEALLRSEVERGLRPWRARESRRQQTQRDAAECERVIGSAMFHATMRAPREWDWEMRRAFERELREVLEEEVEPGMDHDEADAIALDLLDEWMNEDE